MSSHTQPKWFLPAGISLSMESVHFLGDRAILLKPKLGLFCSVKCPGELISRTYDFAQRLRAENRTVISGFHSPMERECLRIFLNGPQHVIIVPARGLPKRVPGVWRKPLDQRRLLIASPFPAEVDRATLALGEQRNAFVAASAEEVFIAFAAAGSKTERFARSLAANGKRLRCLASHATENLLKIGAVPVG